MLTIVSVLLLLFLTIGILNYVHAESAKEYNKVYVSIEIKQGDTLTSIAERYAVSSDHYEDYIEELCYINNLKNDTLYTGCYLLIPVYTEK